MLFYESVRFQKRSSAFRMKREILLLKDFVTETVKKSQI
ncbi:hypothetical protein Cabys_119 [Caldithrix abyssi DSM 13497]|uniref:Uncharacterized protein n=1 Tax=Caldithrix abyssi DSM 13497 TaxID=880073 RepID=A0A1J1C2T5_CALAY|nr:hypothetical protein Cabys_119 [Caldithrix abyssi DSM 13497]